MDYELEVSLTYNIEFWASLNYMKKLYLDITTATTKLSLTYYHFHEKLNKGGNRKGIRLRKEARKVTDRDCFKKQHPLAIHDFSFVVR